MKRLLMLGGADIQISAIKRARELGYYVITCDYLPDNPGHQFSDEYHNVSTTDKEAVLELARKLNINGISSYASDPGALTAAFVSDALELPGNSFESVSTMSDKFEFRSVQHAAGVPTPRVWEIDSVSDVTTRLEESQGGLIIKPADTSGSKGVFVLDKEEKHRGQAIADRLTEARSYSRSKRLIAEEFLVRSGPLMSGDFIVVDGEIEFYCFGDVHFNTCVNGLVPRSISLPGSLSEDAQRTAIEDVRSVIGRLGMRTGVFNMDMIQTLDGRVVCIDIGARNGGNMFNDIIHWNSGVDLIELGLLQCMGEDLKIPEKQQLKYCAHNVLHSSETGVLKNIWFSESLKKKIRYQKINVQVGDLVHRFDHSGHRCGLLLLEFDSFDQMQDVLQDIHSHIKLELE